MKKCSSCGFEQNPDNSRFCIRCGAPLSGGQAAAAGPAQQGQSTWPANASTQKTGSFPAASPASGASRPSPYAALPHIPSSAKGRKTPPKKSRWPALLGGTALIALCVCVLFLLIQIGIGEGQSSGSSPSPTSAPYTYRLGGDAQLTGDHGANTYLIQGSIYIDSKVQFSQANITVSIYWGDSFVTSATDTVAVRNNKISYCLPVRMDSFHAQVSDAIRVRINDIY